MIWIIDTSVWIALFRDKTNVIAAKLRETVGQDKVVMAPPVKLEIMQGCRDNAQWASIEKRVSAFEMLKTPDALWIDAARIYFELRQSGSTIRSALDCCISVYALSNQATLIHNDRDFEAITTIRPLKQIRLDVTKAVPNP
jgi:predicted nucleic acid-binding protein